MSRTIRAQSGDRWWRKRNVEIGSWWWRIQWTQSPSAFSKYWESDAPDRHGPVSSLVKEASRTSRRADTRKEISLIMKDVEHEFRDREGVYKGYSWHFD